MGLLDSLNPFSLIEKGLDYASREHENYLNRQAQFQMQQKAMDFQAEQSQIMRDWQTQERENAQQWENETWLNQQQYLSPVNQMARMQEAGINPNDAVAAISGAPSVSTPTAPSPSVPSVSAPTVNSGSNATPSSLMGLASKAQLANIVSDTQLKSSQSDLVQAQTEGQIIDNDYKPFEYESDLDLASAKIDLMVRQGELAYEQAVQVKEMLPLLKDLNVKQQLVFEAQVNEVNKRIQQMNAEISLLAEKIKTEQAQQKYLDAAESAAREQAEVNKSIVTLNGKELTYKDALIVKQQLENGVSAIKYNFRKFMMDKYGIDIDDHHVDRLIDIIGSVVGVYGVKHKISFIRSLWSETKMKLHSLGSAVDDSFDNIFSVGDSSAPPSIPASLE